MNRAPAKSVKVKRWIENGADGKPLVEVTERFGGAHTTRLYLRPVYITPQRKKRRRG